VIARWRCRCGAVVRARLALECGCAVCEAAPRYVAPCPACAAPVAFLLAFVPAARRAPETLDLFAPQPPAGGNRPQQTR
jgi:hypothetical protein